MPIALNPVADRQRGQVSVRADEEKNTLDRSLLILVSFLCLMSSLNEPENDLIYNNGWQQFYKPFLL